jgi:hypothetical protein
MSRMNLSDTVQDIAPPPPPCFADKFIWREYLISFAASQHRKGEHKVFILQLEAPPTFNYRLNFCRDCDRSHRESMAFEQRCRPDYLQQINPNREYIR